MTAGSNGILATLNPFNWSLALRVPAVVVVLMVSVSIAVTNRVLNRLEETQNRHLAQLAGAYLDGLSSALLPHMLRDDVWEVYDVLERAGQRYKGLDIAWTTVTDAGDLVMASSQPQKFALQTRLPGKISNRYVAAVEVSVDQAGGIANLKRIIVHQDRPIGAIYAEVQIGPLISERSEVLRTLVLTNSLLALLFAGVGYAAVRRMLRPVGLLAEHMRESAEGAISQIQTSDLGRPQSESGCCSDATTP